MFIRKLKSKGFIGRNGCGKSTFMRVIGARSFPIADGIDIFHLKEEIEPSDLTAKEAVMEVDSERALLEKEVFIISYTIISFHMMHVYIHTFN